MDTEKRDEKIEVLQKRNAFRRQQLRKDIILEGAIPEAKGKG